MPLFFKLLDFATKTDDCFRSRPWIPVATTISLRTFAALGVETNFSTRVSRKSTKGYGSLSYIVDCTYVALHTTNRRFFLAAIAQIVAITSAPRQWHSGGKSSTSDPHLNWHFLRQSILNIISYRLMQKVPARTRKPWREKIIHHQWPRRQLLRQR